MDLNENNFSWSTFCIVFTPFYECSPIFWEFFFFSSGSLASFFLFVFGFIQMCFSQNRRLTYWLTMPCRLWSDSISNRFGIKQCEWQCCFRSSTLSDKIKTIITVSTQNGYILMEMKAQLKHLNDSDITIIILKILNYENIIFSPKLQ